jgi:hypothetical protein
MLVRIGAHLGTEVVTRVGLRRTYLVIGQNVISLGGIRSSVFLAISQNARAQGLRCACDRLARAVGLSAT